MKTLIAIALATAACATAPDVPTWQGDVMPILASNCVRCHGYPAAFGAPPSFRLDVYGPTIDPATGAVMLGAGSMAPFMATRVGDGSMPPIFPLVNDGKGVIRNWGLLAQDPFFQLTPAPGFPVPETPPPLGATRAADATISIEQLSTPGDYHYQIDDPDFDLVYGTLQVDGPDGPVTVALNLHNGDSGDSPLHIAPELFAQVNATTGKRDFLPLGDLPMTAVLVDGGAVISRPANWLHVAADSAGRPPFVAIDAPAHDTLFNTNVGPVAVVVEADDPDATDTLTLTVQIFDKDHPKAPPITIADHVPVDRAMATMTATWTNAIAGRWTAEAQVSDGQHVTSVSSTPFRVSTSDTSTTTHTFFKPGTPPTADVQAIFDKKCTPCHGECTTVAFLAHDWRHYSTALPNVPDPTDADMTKIDAGPDACKQTLDGVGDNVGLIYERVVVREDMPPISAGVNGQLTADERMILTKWLLAGAPCGGVPLLCPP